MHAAIVHSFDHPPRYEEFAVPVPGPRESLVEVLAVGLHPRVRSGANNSHYTGEGVLPMIPGIDGVGRRADGQVIFFVAGDSPVGTMADYAVVDERRSVVVPDGLDPVVAAAAMNPAMSSWVALRRRVDFQPGQRVLVLGATGNAGQMAVQIAKRLGASEVVAAGRHMEKLQALAAAGADTVLSLSGSVDDVFSRYAAAAEVDLVIDYLWGPPAEQAMTAILTQRSERSRPLSWIQIGAVTGPSINLPSQLLRSANFNVLGSGQGSVSTAGYVAELPALLDELRTNRLAVNAKAIPLAEVESAWSAPADQGERIVFTPSP